MSGHSKWTQIKHKKGAADAKRGKLFSKLSMAISVAAKENPDPSTNTSLKNAIEKARSNKVPVDTIERAIKRVTETKEKLDVVILEAYGPEGIAIVIEALTDSKNRTLGEIKALLSNHGAKLGGPGSAQWAFEQTTDGERKAKFPQEISPSSKEQLSKLSTTLDDRDDVSHVWTNEK